MTDISSIQTIVNELIQHQPDEHDVRWVLLSQALSSGRNEPIIRKPELQNLVSQAINSPMIHFRKLAYHQLLLQMKYPGATEFLVQLNDFPRILRAIGDANESIAANTEKIISMLSAEVLTTPQYSQILREMANSSDTIYIRVYSAVLSVSSSSAESFNLIKQDGWFESFHSRMNFHENWDPLIVLNLIEIESQLVQRGLEAEEQIQILIWSEIEATAIQAVETIACDKLQSFLLAPLLLHLGRVLHLYLKLSDAGALSVGEFSDFESQMASILDQYCNSDDVTIREAIVIAAGIFSITSEAQQILFATPSLSKFYLNALYASKSVYLSFIHSVTEALKASKTAQAQAFCGRVLSHEKLEIILKYANSPYVDEREVVYKLFDQLAGTEFGREMIFRTHGLLVWLTDRGQIIESNPEAVSRYSILEKLVAVPEQCTNSLGDQAYLRIKEYLSEGIYYCPPQFRAVVQNEADD